MWEREYFLKNKKKLSHDDVKAGKLGPYGS